MINEVNTTLIVERSKISDRSKWYDFYGSTSRGGDVQRTAIDMVLLDCQKLKL